MNFSNAELNVSLNRDIEKFVEIDNKKEEFLFRPI